MPDVQIDMELSFTSSTRGDERRTVSGIDVPLARCHCAGRDALRGARWLVGRSPNRKDRCNVVLSQISNRRPTTALRLMWPAGNRTCAARRAPRAATAAASRRCVRGSGSAADCFEIRSMRRDGCSCPPLDPPESLPLRAAWVGVAPRSNAHRNKQGKTSVRRSTLLA